jgi:dienelactone hydrolase
VKAVVGFHAGLVTTRPQESHNIGGSVLVCIGADDPLISSEQRDAFEEEMRPAGVDWRMNLYGGVEHSFTHQLADSAGIPGIKYDALADARSWRAMLDLFDETLR